MAHIIWVLQNAMDRLICLRPPLFDLSVFKESTTLEKYNFRFKPVGLSMTWAQFSTPIIDIILVIPLLLS